MRSSSTKRQARRTNRGSGSASRPYADCQFLDTSHDSGSRIPPGQCPHRSEVEVPSSARTFVLPVHCVHCPLSATQTGRTGARIGTFSGSGCWLPTPSARPADILSGRRPRHSGSEPAALPPTQFPRLWHYPRVASALICPPPIDAAAKCSNDASAAERKKGVHDR